MTEFKGAVNVEVPPQVLPVGPVEVDRCGNRLAVRIPDIPADQWDTAECIQEYNHARRWNTPCNDGQGTTWRVVS